MCLEKLPLVTFEKHSLYGRQSTRSAWSILIDISHLKEKSENERKIINICKIIANWYRIHHISAA